MDAYKCDYCGHMAVIQEHYPPIQVKRTQRRKVPPPPGARDMDVYDEKEVTDTYEYRRFELCKDCGATKGSYRWEESDSGHTRESMKSIHRDEYDHYRAGWVLWAKKAVVNGIPASEIDLDRIGDLGYLREINQLLQSRVSRNAQASARSQGSGCILVTAVFALILLSVVWLLLC